MTPSDLLGKKIGQWCLERYINSGKSAHVYQGKRGEETAAIKVFLPELVEKQGEAVQLERIKRQLSLVDKRHPNLIDMLDGGKCTDTGFLYVVMEYLDFPTAGQVREEVPTTHIGELISQVADAARFLEQHDLVHRDIKPDNILIAKSFDQAVLMDLGVIKPLKAIDITNTEEPHFVGTLRYSPPEFQVDEVEGSKESWQAVTFYQLGTVLYELIYRRVIFGDVLGPYPRLVRVIQENAPNFDGAASGIDQRLTTLARDCLEKDPATRVRLVSWERFAEIRFPVKDLRLDLRNAIKARQREYQVKAFETFQEGDAVRQKKVKARANLEAILDTIDTALKGAEVFPSKSCVRRPISEHLKASAVVEFVPDTALGLDQKFGVVVDLSPIDADRDICTVGFSGFVCHTDCDCGDIVAPKFTFEIKGAIKDICDVARYESFFLEFLNSVYEDQSTAKALSPSEIRWI